MSVGGAEVHCKTEGQPNVACRMKKHKECLKLLRKIKLFSGWTKTASNYLTSSVTAGQRPACGNGFYWLLFLFS